MRIGRMLCAWPAVLLLGNGATAPARAAETGCTVTGRLRESPHLSRAAVCRAVLEGIGDTRGLGRMTIAISFEPPATATADLVKDGVPHAPVSIAISDRALGRRDLVELGRTIARLVRAY